MDLFVNSRTVKVTVRDIISVQDDTNTQVIEFVFDRNEVEYDLTTLNPFVLYKTTLDKGVRFEICTQTSTEDEIRVQWTIRKPVTYAQGKLEFQVVFTDTPDPVTKVSDKRWSTKIATVTIPQTLAVENYAIDPEPIVEQMMGIASQVIGKTDLAEDLAKRAETAADTATQKATEASTSAGNAKTSETNAKTSETKAIAKAQEAEQSATRAAEVAKKLGDIDSLSAEVKQAAAEVRKISSELQGALAEVKLLSETMMKKPAVEGISGQVLISNGDGTCVWTDWNEIPTEFIESLMRSDQ